MCRVESLSVNEVDDMALKMMVCPACGANIDIRPDAKAGRCEYCGTSVMIESNTHEFVFRDEARLRELELQEQQRQRQEAQWQRQEIQRQQERQREDVMKTLSILTSDEAGDTLKSVGRLALRFLKNKP